MAPQPALQTARILGGKNGHLVGTNRLDLDYLHSLLRGSQCAWACGITPMSGPELPLRQLAQFVERLHGALLYGGQAGHGNQPAEFLQRPLIFHLEQQILPAGIVNNNRLLCRFVDVNILVPREDETAVAKRWQEGQPTQNSRNQDPRHDRPMPRWQPIAAEVLSIRSHIAPRSGEDTNPTLNVIINWRDGSQCIGHCS